MLLENQEFAPQDPLNEAFIHEEEPPSPILSLKSSDFKLHAVLFNC